MRSVSKHIILSLCVVLSNSKVYSQPGQCLAGGCNTGTLFGTTQTTTSSVFVNSVASTWAGEYNTYNVTAGQQYEWSLCPADGAIVGVANSQLTLTDNVTNTLICYSDNVCGNHAKILWTATFTGVVRVYIHSFNCTASSVGHTVRWRCVTCTSLPGSTCANAVNIASVPFSQNGQTTCGFGNDYNSSNACFSVYMDGDDFVYSYTPTTNQCINIALTGTSTWTGVFVTNGCPSVGTCVAQATSSGGNPVLTNVNLIAGNTYYIIISTWPSPNCTPFNISITTCSALPPGSTCANAIVIPSVPFSQNGQTTCGFGNDYNSSNACFSSYMNGEDFVYTYTPPTNQCVNISLTGTLGWTGLFVTNGCPTVGTCVAQNTNSLGNPGISNLNLIAGVTYYIIISTWPAPNCTPFNITINTCTGPVTAADCPNAVNVCTNLNFAVDPNGYGTTNELCTNCISNPGINPASTNFGCLLVGELNSTWMVVNIASSGTLQFSFGAPGAGVCYDWIMWPYNSSTCSQILSNTLAPIRCNWNSPCDGFTGISSVPPMGGFATNFEPDLNVTAGQQYLICFSNYSSATTNVPLNFFGTANVSCTPLEFDILSFSGMHSLHKNVLSWQIPEINTITKFDLQKLSLATGIFETINTQFVNSQTVNYFYYDNDVTEDVTYYKLNYFSISGNEKSSDIIAVYSNIINTTDIFIYPNPFDDYTTLQFNNDDIVNTVLQITDLAGKIIYTQNITSTSVLLNTTSFAKGIYLLNVKNPLTGECYLTQKFVKK